MILSFSLFKFLFSFFLFFLNVNQQISKLIFPVPFIFTSLLKMPKDAYSKVYRVYLPLVITPENYIALPEEIDEFIGVFRVSMVVSREEPDFYEEYHSICLVERGPRYPPFSQLLTDIHAALLDSTATDYCGEHPFFFLFLVLDSRVKPIHGTRETKKEKDICLRKFW